MDYLLSMKRSLPVYRMINRMLIEEKPLPESNSAY